MAPMRIGKLKKKEDLFYVFEWQLPNFFSIPAEVGMEIHSPSFNFVGERWRLEMFPNGSEEDDSEGYIGIFLKRESSGPTIELEFTLGVKTLYNEIVEEELCTNEFDAVITGCGWINFLKRYTLLRKAFRLVPSGTLTWVCRVKQPESSYVANLESVCQDYKKVLLDGSNHDLFLKVGNNELRAHRDILKARSKVFHSMLNNDMMEKNSGAIIIPDCDPKTMEQFLLHVYCGRVEELDQNNMLGLYYIADKYEMMKLKEECHNFIKKSLSTTNFCNIIQLALNHSDSSLLEYATDYFNCNMMNILRTTEWKTLMNTNFTLANEIFIRCYGMRKVTKICFKKSKVVYVNVKNYDLKDH